MPESFYKIERNPFSKAPDPENLYLTDEIEEAIARLEHAALQREIAVLTGDIGVGKTTATRVLVDRLDDEVEIVWILNPRLTPNQLLHQIAIRLGVDPVPRNRVELLDAVQERIFAAWSNGKPVVLLIDEAQMLPFPDTIEELRLLTNIQMDQENLIGVLLVGQPELSRRLLHPRLRPLAQRIGIRFHLGPLDTEQVSDYVHSRIASVGRKKAMFDDGAIAAIAENSNGIPRVVNNICANAILEGYVRQQDPITRDIVLDVSTDLGLVA